MFGVFSITATLSRNKLDACIEEFQSIPKRNPVFDFYQVDPKMALAKWHTHFPFKGVFAFSGDINQKWESELNEMVKKNGTVKSSLPDLIIINKKGMIVKIESGVTQFPFWRGYQPIKTSTSLTLD